jgi:hypothetical protein
MDFFGNSDMAINVTLIIDGVTRAMGKGQMLGGGGKNISGFRQKAAT